MTDQQTVALYALKKNKLGVVSHFSDERLASRMLSLGVVPGSVIKVFQVAPLGGGMYIQVDNMRIAIRKNEAAKIFVKYAK